MVSRQVLDVFSSSMATQACEKARQLSPQLLLLRRATLQLQGGELPQLPEPGATWPPFH
jgi:hypothetical protein